jgi:purine-binding chemotaxis protein CheW
VQVYQAVILGPQVDNPRHLVKFILDDQSYAIPLPLVERVVRAVALTRLPKAPPIVLGIINVGGAILPVVNIRKRFRLPDREAGLRDHMIIAITSRRKVVLPVDSAFGVEQYREDSIVNPDQIVPQIQYVQGVAKLHNGLVLIHNIDTFLSLDEHNALDDALI